MTITDLTLAELADLIEIATLRGQHPDRRTHTGYTHPGGQDPIPTYQPCGDPLVDTIAGRYPDATPAERAELQAAVQLLAAGSPVDITPTFRLRRA